MLQLRHRVHGWPCVPLSVFTEFHDLRVNPATERPYELTVYSQGNTKADMSHIAHLILRGDITLDIIDQSINWSIKYDLKP